jgi:hypothetical protein
MSVEFEQDQEKNRTIVANAYKINRASHSSISNGHLFTSRENVGPCYLELGSEVINTCPFLDKPINVQLYLYNSSHQLIQGHNIPIEVKVLYQGSDQILQSNEICVSVLCYHGVLVNLILDFLTFRQSNQLT